MQPTYFPWSGYFNLILCADVFVFLDDVQYEKTSWQNRNRVLVNGQPHWITVPARRDRLSQLIKDTMIEENNRWREKQMTLLHHSYGKHPYREPMMDVAEIILDASEINLANLNIRIIETICERTGIATRFVRSSELGISGERSERLVRVCQHFDCDEYLSPAGAKQYLEEDGSFARSTVRLAFHDYVPGSYPQHRAPSFVSHLSILDVIANLGFGGTLEYIRTGSLAREVV